MKLDVMEPRYEELFDLSVEVKHEFNSWYGLTIQVIFIIYVSNDNYTKRKYIKNDKKIIYIYKIVLHNIITLVLHNGKC